MNLKKLMILALALSVALCLCACGGNGNKTDVPATTTQNNGEADSGNVVYTVVVEDEYGDPVCDAIVQLEADAVLKNSTDEDGVVVFQASKADYTVSLAPVPEGYTASADAFAFPEGEYELIITLTSTNG